MTQYDVNPNTMLSYLNDKEVLVRSAIAQYFNETQHVSYLKGLLPLLNDNLGVSKPSKHWLLYLLRT